MAQILVSDRCSGFRTSHRMTLGLFVRLYRIKLFNITVIVLVLSAGTAFSVAGEQINESGIGNASH